ncbi:MAG TPA: prepilin-type N-terminal cleavage/methylation domain-containing protein [Gammaproteobacteria bacterium]|nr:prepilin-type N-terminal cleavage/methylation domain-containing protein [Gammaproteobacteria bacterium]
MKNQKGASLLEVLLVLAIACIILVMSYRYYENYKIAGEVGRLQSSVAQLMDALNEYYFIHCQQGDDKDVTIQKLKDAGLLNNYIVNPWGSFSVAIKDNNLTVTAIFSREQELVPFINGALNGTLGTDVKILNAVTWTRLPTYSTGDLFMYPGRQVTVMNKGLSSKLWVLNSELEIFTHQQSRNAC